MPDKLERLLQEQSDLQYSMPTKHPHTLFAESQEAFARDADRTPAIDFITWNVLALEDELHELLAETGWKPWAKSKHINLEAARGEAIDALHFLLNLFLVLGMDADDVLERYLAKRQKNQKRQEADYDGVSTKCPGCKRALDDDAVECTFKPGVPSKECDQWFCVVSNTYYMEPIK